MKSRSEPVAEISAGELIGEIGFFSGQCRTATVVAARDSAVAKLDRAAFDEVVAANPKKSLVDVVVRYFLKAPK